MLRTDLATWICWAELALAGFLLARDRVRKWWFARVVQRPRYLGLCGEDYVRYEFFAPLPKPLDPLTAAIAKQGGWVAWLRDERKHEPQRMGLLLAGGDGFYQNYALDTALVNGEVLAVFQTNEELDAWKRGFAWPKYTGVLDEAE